jgi:hypothetical protein
MGHDIALSEGTAFRPEARLELIEEPEIEVDRFVGWAVEGSDG